MSSTIYIEENVPLFESIYGKGLISLGHLEAIDNMFLNIDLQNKTLIDIGSGIGGMAYHLARQYGCKVIGLEIHPWMTEYATTHAPENIKDNVKFISYAPNTSIPISDQSIHIACSKGVLTNVENKLALFQELYRILNHKGQIVFIDWLVPESSGPKYDRLRLGDMSFKETQASYKHILEKAGFNHLIFIDQSAEYLKYVNQLDKMYHSIEHQKQYAHIINASLREMLIQSNRDLKQSIESGQQYSMRILANKP